MTLPVALLSLATATPPHPLDQATALAVARDLLGGAVGDFERMAPVFASAGVEQRQLARPAPWYSTPRDIAERNATYLESALYLFVDAATRALAEAGLAARDVDTIVTVSSTGIATPSLDARALGRMDFRSDVSRVPVFGLGCAGGVSGLGIAARLARAGGGVVLFVAVELCSLAFRTEHAGKADIVSAALFGDGAAACILKAGDEGFATITGSAEKTWPGTLDIMGWTLEPHGLGVVLNRAVPAFVRDRFRPAMDEMLASQGQGIHDIDRFLCHPGGARVADAIEQALGLAAGALDIERAVLRAHGNMSAPTVLFVLDRARRAGLPPRSALAALGPGFTASLVLLERAA